jgi:hypothetical protein
LAALRQPVPADLHHPVRGPDHDRPPPPVLDPAQHPRPGLVPVPTRSPRRPAVDSETGLGLVTRTSRVTRAAALHRAGPLVAPGHRHPVAIQRCHLLHHDLHHRPLAATRPDQLGHHPERGLGSDPVPVAGLARR